MNDDDILIRYMYCTKGWRGITKSGKEVTLNSTEYAHIAKIMSYGLSPNNENHFTQYFTDILK